MKFARVVYWIAAGYGFVSLVPLYFMLDKVGRDAPPPVTHPEFYYGFLGVTFLWQIVFALIANEPLRYRSLMPITILEKLVYTAPVILLYLDGMSTATSCSRHWSIPFSEYSSLLPTFERQRNSAPLQTRDKEPAKE